MLFPEFNNHKRSVVFALLSISLLLLAYVVVRTITVPFTTDESFSYVVYVRKGILFPSSFDFMSANFHFLNTIGMWICLKIFGNAEWSLRMPNVIGFILYLYFCLRFALRNRNAVMVISGFLLLVIHPYLLDLFSVARGYGLSYGLLFGGIFHSIRFAESKGMSAKHLRFSLLFFSLAWMASFVLTYCFLLNLIFLSFIIYRSADRQGRKWRFAELAVITALVAFIVLPMIKGMQTAGAFTWGALKFADSFMTLKSEFLYWGGTSSRFFEQASSDIPAITGMSVVIILLVFLFVMMRSVKNTGFRFLIFLFLGSITVIALQHYKLGSPFPMGRTQLYLILILLLSIVLSLEQWRLNKNVSIAISGVLVIPFLVIFFLKSNFTHTHDWSFGRDIKSEIAFVTADMKKSNDSLPVRSIAADNVEYQNTVYYLERFGHPGIPVAMRYEDIDYPVAYYYLVDTVYAPKLKRHATLMEKYPASGDVVMKDDSLSGSWNR